MNLAAIIVAGGSGKRFGSAKPKQFLLLQKNLCSYGVFSLLKKSNNANK